MDDDIKKFIECREERLTFAGKKLVVRELEMAAEYEAVRDKKDAIYMMMLKCVLNEDGSPFFSPDDIPTLKRASQTKLLPIIQAVHRVMGEDAGEEIKNSDAAPAGGSS